MLLPPVLMFKDGICAGHLDTGQAYARLPVLRCLIRFFQPLVSVHDRSGPDGLFYKPV